MPNIVNVEQSFKSRYEESLKDHHYEEADKAFSKAAKKYYSASWVVTGMKYWAYDSKWEVLVDHYERFREKKIEKKLTEKIENRSEIILQAFLDAKPSEAELKLRPEKAFEYQRFVNESPNAYFRSMIPQDFERLSNEVNALTDNAIANLGLEGISLQKHTLEEIGQLKKQNTKYLKYMKANQALWVKAYEHIEKIEAGQDSLSDTVEELPEKFKQLFQLFGAPINSKLNFLREMDAELLELTTQVVDYINEKKKDAEKQKQFEYNESKHRHLDQGFSMVANIGLLVKSQTLYKAGQVAIQAHTIARQGSVILQVLKAAGPGLQNLDPMMLMDPIYSIFTAALAGIALFQTTMDPNEIILEQLRSILNEINAIREQLAVEFNLVHLHLELLGEKIEFLFDKLEYTLTTPVKVSLQEISDDIRFLTEVVQVGFQHVLIQELDSAIQLANSYTEGVVPPESLDQQSYYKLMSNLASWLTQNNKNDVFSGRHFFDSLAAVQKNYRKLIDILSNAGSSTRQIASLTSLLNGFAHQLTNSIDENNIVNPLIWHMALLPYIQLRKQYDAVYPYDADLLQLDQIIARLTEIDVFITMLQTNSQLYSNLLDEMQAAIAILKQTYNEAIISAQVQNPELFFNDFENSLKESQGKVLSNTQLSVGTVTEIKGNHDRFVNIVLNFQNAHPRLNYPNVENYVLSLLVAQNRVPSEFLLASFYNLGYLELVVYESYMTPNGKTKISMSEKIGVQCTFIMKNGMRIPLTQPGGGLIHHGFGNGDNAPALRAMFESRVIPSSISIVSPSDLTLIRQLSMEHVLQKRKEILAKISNHLKLNNDASSKMEAMKQLLFAFLHLAGAPTAIIEEIIENLNSSDIINDIDSYIAIGDIHTAFPVELKLPSDNNLLQLEEILNDLCQRSMVDDDFRKQFYVNEALVKLAQASEILLGYKLELYTHQMLALDSHDNTIKLLGSGKAPNDNTNHAVAKGFDYAAEVNHFVMRLKAIKDLVPMTEPLNGCSKSNTVIMRNSANTHEHKQQIFGFPGVQASRIYSVDVTAVILASKFLRGQIRSFIPAVPKSCDLPMTIPVRQMAYRLMPGYTLHETTGQPIFTVGAYENDLVLGYIKLYGTDIFCRSRSGRHHNVIELGGILEGQFERIDPMVAEEICQVLPPNEISLGERANHALNVGVLRGGTHFFSKCLTKAGAPDQLAFAAGQVFFHAAYFLLRYQQYQEDYGEVAQQVADEMSPAIQAAYDTLTLLTVQAASMGTSYAGRKLGDLGWNKVGTGLNRLGRAFGFAGYSPAFFSAYQQPSWSGAATSLAESAVEIGAGVTGQVVVEEAGNSLLRYLGYS